MAGNEIGLSDEIGRANRRGTKTQMRNRNGTRFLRIVNKITLSVVWSIFADNFDRVFIGAHGAVRTEAVK